MSKSFSYFLSDTVSDWIHRKIGRLLRQCDFSPTSSGFVDPYCLNEQCVGRQAWIFTNLSKFMTSLLAEQFTERVPHTDPRRQQSSFWLKSLQKHTLSQHRAVKHTLLAAPLIRRVVQNTHDMSGDTTQIYLEHNVNALTLGRNLYTII